MQSTAARKIRNDSRHLVEIVAFVLLMFVGALAVGVALSGVVILLSGSASAAETDAPRMRSGDAGQGTLLFKPHGGGDTFVAPLLDTDVHIKVSGIVARATVRQTFRNPHPDWLEGIYVFPLPESAAVDHMRMRIGQRIIEGDIKERAAAKAQYEQAKQSGQRATLVEQERPNIFTTSVANIGPNDEVVVEIEYQQSLHYDSIDGEGRFSLRFPMVVGPRYIPGNTTVAGSAGSGWGGNTDQVTDAARITPPVLRPQTDQAPINPVHIHVDLDAGVPLAAVTSAYHKVQVHEADSGRRIVELAEGTTPANRDFELNWVPQPQQMPQVALFSESKGGRDYALLMLMPPTAHWAQKHLPRETIFVIDTSGSMEGTSILQAREALQLALLRLGPQDRFNVIEFNSDATPLFREAKAASADNLQRAAAFVRNLKATGGTEMASALNLALNSYEDPGRVRQVIFLTDGAVGNEEQLFKLIQDKLGDSTLFTVGIGAAPNGYFMTKAAQAGRGTYTYIGKVDEVKDKMSALFAKLEAPVLKGVTLDWTATDVEQWPQRLPDLYLGEPIVVSAAADKLQGSVLVLGFNGDQPWHAQIDLGGAMPGEGVGVRWAREKIGALTDKLREGANENDIRAEVVDIALAHHLVSKYTSLVAVDKTPARPADAALNSGAMPTNLPDGWNYDAVFGELPQGATDARFDLLIGMIAMFLASLLLLHGRRGVVLRV